MRRDIALVAASAFALPLMAQEPAAALPGPSPEHKQLERFVGTWDVTVKNFQGPGGEPQTMQGIDESKLTCNGLWLQTKVVGAPDSMPFEGHALTGYDPLRKQYVSVWIDVMSTTPSRASGTYDAKTGSFTYLGEMASPDGMMQTRSITAFEGNDVRTEKVFAIVDGKEQPAMELRYVRQRQPKAVPAALTGGKPTAIDTGMPSPKVKQHALLSQCTGVWQADCSMAIPGAPAITGKMTQTDTLICNDLWLLTRAVGTFGGKPFEGIGFLGYDTGKKQYVGFWVDGMAPVLSESQGDCDAAGKQLTLRGKANHDGREVDTEDVTTFVSASEKSLVMKSKTKEGAEASTLTIRYSRQETVPK